MNLERINPETIEFNRQQRVYRAIPQGFFESDMFYSAEHAESPTYLSRNGNGGTFVTQDIIKGLGYGCDWTSLMRPEDEIPAPFTSYVTLLSIDARPYLDRLYQEPPNEGIIIRGAIALDDIEVLFSAEKDTLNTFDEDAVVLPSRKRNSDVSVVFRGMKQSLRDMAGNLPETTLITRYWRDTERVADEIRQYLDTCWQGKHLNGCEDVVAALLPKVVDFFERGCVRKSAKMYHLSSSAYSV